MVVDALSPRLTAPLLAIALTLAIASGASAQDDAPPPPVDVARPFFAGGGIGVGVRLDGFVPAAFRIVEEVGLHLDGVPVGPFVALMLAQDASSYFSMQIGVRVGWDLELLRRPDFSIVVSPSLGVAFAFDVGTPTGDWAYFLVQPALGVGVLLLDRVLAIWLRPIGVDVYVGEQIHGGWASVLGASVAF
ncbi:hypothetical protein [Sandaracinus amylolyticus]|uniref:Outer membrane protein beta-barrel domain-containing protein n=1 Tax=Sandaracinus amylolyticus TaxID=927083 RepID=A0A0F6YLG9_9BACT|nr:hypothetical protein [Sandaracinus amylolyticus]AKF08332.1 hypothetical protein DB32_005481 [Sandaracinus amylolyticus]